MSTIVIRRTVAVEIYKDGSKRPKNKEVRGRRRRRRRGEEEKKKKIMRIFAEAENSELYPEILSCAMRDASVAFPGALGSACRASFDTCLPQKKQPRAFGSASEDVEQSVA